jgi:hypothetical protein
MMARIPAGPQTGRGRWRVLIVETAAGIVLIVISAIEIAWIVRIVQANMRRG